MDDQQAHGSASRQIYWPWELGEAQVYASIVGGLVFSLVSGLWAPWVARKTGLAGMEPAIGAVSGTVLVFFMIPGSLYLRRKLRHGFAPRRTSLKYLVHVLVALALTVILQYPSLQALLTSGPASGVRFYLNWVIYTFVCLNAYVLLTARQLTNDLARERATNNDLRTASASYSEYVNRSFMFLRMTYDTILSKPFDPSKVTEESFGQQCRQRIRDTLAACALVKSFSTGQRRKTDESRASLVWASVYVLDAGSSGRGGPVFREDITSLPVGVPQALQTALREVDGTRGILSWVMNENETKNRNQSRPWRANGDIVLTESLPPAAPGFSGLPARSAIARRIEFHGHPIGVWVVLSDTPGYFGEADVFPIVVLSDLVVFSYAHLCEHCAWHRKGWREGKGKLTRHTDEKMFIFDPSRYSGDHFATLAQRSSAYGADKEIFQRVIHDVYQQSFARVFSRREEICSVHLIGSFNGWKTDEIQMDYGDGVWRESLNLPKGTYSYAYQITSDVGGICECEVVFDPCSPLVRELYQNRDVINSQATVP